MSECVRCGRWAGDHHSCYKGWKKGGVLPSRSFGQSRGGKKRQVYPSGLGQSKAGKSSPTRAFRRIISEQPEMASNSVLVALHSAARHSAASHCITVGNQCGQEGPGVRGQETHAAARAHQRTQNRTPDTCMHVRLLSLQMLLPHLEPRSTRNRSARQLPRGRLHIACMTSLPYSPCLGVSHSHLLNTCTASYPADSSDLADNPAGVVFMHCCSCFSFMLTAGCLAAAAAALFTR